MTSPSQEGPPQTEADVASVVLAAEGVLAEIEQFSFFSVRSELPTAADEVLREGVSRMCCRFAGRVTAANNESANTLLEIALSSEFGEYTFSSANQATFVLFFRVDRFFV